MRVPRAWDVPNGRWGAQFYERHACSEDEVSRSIGEAMLVLLRELRESTAPHEVWGLTSHYHLCLLAENRCDTPWYVQVIGYEGRYQIEYLVPQVEAPWPEARVRGDASSARAAVAMILTALVRSGGWRSQGAAA